jgi:phosphopantothenoylcysteine decarboxylase/phosphopantothenate--cysteine ligase
LTGADTGRGRLPEPTEIARLAELLLLRPAALPQDLAGRRVLITAGGTREPLDPVRFLGNRSSGRQGYDLASVAAARGARVTLVAANVDLPAPAAAELVEVGTAEQLRAATLAGAKDADVVVMAAAVADFRPASAAPAKIKKTAGVPEPVPLTANPDVLTDLVAARAAGELSTPVIVGFAAETGDQHADVLAHGRAKLARKGCDLLVVNEVSATKVFGRPDNAAVILSRDGAPVEIPLGPKTVLAAALYDAVGPLLAR